MFYDEIITKLEYFGARIFHSHFQVTTLASTFPVKEVATAAAVSTSTTAMVVAIVCCCCFPCRRKRGRKKNLDVNENEKQGKEEEEGRGDRLFHQRYEGEGCGRWAFQFPASYHE